MYVWIYLITVSIRFLYKIFDISIKEKSAGSLSINNQANRNGLLYIRNRLATISIPHEKTKKSNIDMIDDEKSERFQDEFIFTAIIPRRYPSWNIRKRVTSVSLHWLYNVTRGNHV